MALPLEFNGAQFTEYFSQYLNNIEAEGLTLPSALDNMPDDDNGVSFKQRFIDRNYYKEIGSETEELFTMHLAIKASEVVNRYMWKIEEYTTKRNTMILQYFEATNTQKDEYGGSDSTEQLNQEYYNPVATGTQTDNIIGKDDIARTLKYGQTLTREYTRQIPVVFKDVPSIMKAIFDLEVIYEEALSYMDSLFMVVL